MMYTGWELLFRILGYLLFLAGCLIFWGAVIATLVFGWPPGAIGGVLAGLSFVLGVACFSEGGK